MAGVDEMALGRGMKMPVLGDENAGAGAESAPSMTGTAESTPSIVYDRGQQRLHEPLQRLHQPMGFALTLLDRTFDSIRCVRQNKRCSNNRTMKQKRCSNKESSESIHTTSSLIAILARTSESSDIHFG